MHRMTMVEMTIRVLMMQGSFFIDSILPGIAPDHEAEESEENQRLDDIGPCGCQVGHG